jgi:adenylate cyclase
MGYLRRVQNRLPEAKVELEKAIGLDRSYPPVQLGFTLNALGQPEAALPHFEKALQLNPRSQNVHYSYLGLGQSHLSLGHVDDAIDALRQATASNSRFWQIPLWLAAALGLRGDIDEARAALANLLEIKPEMNSLAQLYRHPVYGYSNSRARHEKTLHAGLRRAGMPEE